MGFVDDSSDFIDPRVACLLDTEVERLRLEVARIEWRGLLAMMKLDVVVAKAGGHIALTVLYEVPDAYARTPTSPPAPLRVQTLLSPFITSTMRGDFLRHVLPNLVMDALRHEAQEGLWVNDKPVNDPHLDDEMRPRLFIR